ncbi:MAG: hypothetical protein GY865_17330, partial [candidate division Zixibacteria bacterium]|nr:hypothetical protein [candidate division Zixibacteria bacterium]
MPEINDNEKLNPQIIDVTVGIRDLRIIRLYPLSIKSQDEMAKVIQSGLEDFFNTAGANDNTQLIKFAMEFIKDNLVKILNLAMCRKESEPCASVLMEDMTNMQMSEIVMSLYRVNYEEPLKNAASLLDKVKEWFLSNRQSQESSS